MPPRSRPKRSSTARAVAAPAPASMPPPPVMAGVQRLRENRVRPARDASLAGEMDRAMREAATLRRATGGCAAAWSATVPPALLARTALEGVSKGVLTVRVPDAATRFELDRWLRGGGQKRMVTESKVSVTKVRVVIGQ